MDRFWRKVIFKGRWPLLFPIKLVLKHDYDRSAVSMQLKLMEEKKKSRTSFRYLWSQEATTQALYELIIELSFCKENNLSYYLLCCK